MRDHCWMWSLCEGVNSKNQKIKVDIQCNWIQLEECRIQLVIQTAMCLFNNKSEIIMQRFKISKSIYTSYANQIM